MEQEHVPTVLLTRSIEDNAQSASVFGAAGLASASLPGILITDPENWSVADTAIRTLETYDGILFTSKNAVQRFLARLDVIRPSDRRLLADMNIAAVGQKTEELLAAEDIRVDIVPEEGTAEDLAAALLRIGVDGKRFLFPKSDIARDVLPGTLREHGAFVEEIEVYRTVPPDGASLEAIRSAIAGGSIQCIAFFSPSAVRHVVEMLGRECINSLTIAAIGPTTAAAIGDLGRTADIVSDRPTVENFAQTIKTYLTGLHTD